MTVELLAVFITLATAGALAGITAGLFGNGGGFVVVPALVFVFSFFDNTNKELIFVAIGTSLATIVISSTRAVIAHHSRGAVDFQILRSWSGWLTVGVIGGLVIASKADPEQLYLVFAFGVLLYAVYFLFPNLIDNLHFKPSMPTGMTRASLASSLGGFSSLLGIGGGTVTVITMVTCRRQMYEAVATASGVGLIIGLTGAVGFIFLGLGQPGLPFGSIGYVNLPALALVGIGSLTTAPIGAKWAHKLDEKNLKRFFGIYLVIVSAAMFWKSSLL